MTINAESHSTTRPRAAWNNWVEKAVMTRVEIAKMIPGAGWDLVIPLVLMNVIVGALPVAFVISTSYLIGRVPAAVDGGLESAAWDSLIEAFLFAAGSFLLMQLLAPVMNALYARLKRRIDGTLRDDVLELTTRTTSIGPMEDQSVLGELSESIRQFDNDWHTPGQAVGGLLSLIARYGSLIAFCVLLGWAFEPWAGVTIFAVVMMFRYGNRGGLRKFSAVWRSVIQHGRNRDYVRELAMGDVSAKETRVFGINDWLSTRYEESHWAMYTPVSVARRKLYFYPYLAITLVGLAGVAWVLVEVGSAAVAGDLTLTQLAFSMSATTGAVALGTAWEESDVPTQFGMRALEALKKLRLKIEAAEELELSRERSDAADLGSGTAGVETTTLPSKSLVFDNLTFAYPGTNEKVIDGLQITIPAGRSTAIVGVNGAGKTTLVKLLTRLYEPDGGAIIADGVNIGGLDAEQWRHQVSVIFQDFVRFEFSAADNIAMGAIHVPRDDAAIREAARKADILDVFDDLPLGLDTPLARAYKDGIDLSGGQWQRVAIARSLYALSQGAKVLVLDEPTSALDVRAEVQFFDRFVELTHGVTSLLISHRFSSVRRADHIIVIDGGSVSEEGSHAELMKSGGHYARLFTLQAERFAKGLSAEGDIVEDEVDPDAVVDLMEGGSDD